MADIRLTYDTEKFVADLLISNQDLALDDSLQTAVVICLFTDRLANSDDVLPDGGTDRRGWWGDSLAEQDDDLIGSRLWLLSREKEITEVLRRAEEYAAESLECLIEDGAVKKFDIVAIITQPGAWVLKIKATRPDGSKEEFNYNFLWDGVRYAL